MRADRGDEVELGGARLGGDVPEPRGGELRHEHERATARGRTAQRIEQRINVEERQHCHQPVVGGEVHALDEAFARQHHVALAVHHALRKAGGPGGVDDDADVVRAAARLGKRRCCRRQRGEGRQAVGARGLQQDAPRSGPQVRHRLERRRRQLARAGDATHPGVLEDVAHLRDAQLRVDRDHPCAEPREREQGDHDVGPRRRVGRDPVAVLDAERRICRRGPQHARLDLTPRNGRALEEEAGLVAIARRPAREQPGQRAVVKGIEAQRIERCHLMSSFARRRGRAAHYELGFEPNVLPARARVRDLGEQHARDFHAHRAMGDAHGRERRREAVGERHVVVAGHRHVARAREPAARELVVTPEREQIVRGHERGHGGVAVEQCGGGRNARGDAVARRLGDQRIARLQSVCAQRGDEARAPCGAGGEPARPGDVRDASMSEPHEVVDGERDPARVVVRDRRRVPRVAAAVHQHHRQSELAAARDEGIAVRYGGENHPVDAAGGQTLERLAGAVGIVVGVGDDRGIAGVAERALDAAQDRRKDRVREVGDQHADRGRTPSAQACRHRVRDVAQPAGHRAHALGHRRGHELARAGAQRAGHGRRVHPRCARNVLNRDSFGGHDAAPQNTLRRRRLRHSMQSIAPRQAAA